jgi:hypothetical protein
VNQATDGGGEGGGSGGGCGTVLCLPVGHVIGSHNSYHPVIRCNKCKKYGHFAGKCPNAGPSTGGGGNGGPNEDDGNEPSVVKKKEVAQTHYLLRNGKTYEYVESDGPESDDDYGGGGNLSGLNYVQSAKVKARKELAENGVDCSSVGSNGKKKCTAVMDSGASHTIIKDSELLEEIWHSNDVLEVELKGGVYEVNMKGTLLNVGEMWCTRQSRSLTYSRSSV